MNESMQPSILAFVSGLPDVSTDMAVKGAVLLVAALAVRRLLRRGSASLRYLILSIGLTGTLLLPAFAIVLPQWRLALLPARSVVAANDPALSVSDVAFPETTSDAPASATSKPIARAPFGSSVGEPGLSALPAESNAGLAGASVESPVALASLHPPTAPAGLELSFGQWLVLLWIVGVVVALVPFVVGFLAQRRVLRGCAELDDPRAARLRNEASESLGLTRSVRLLEAGESIVPLTVGVLWPTIILPRVAREWTAPKVRILLLHELAHVKRLDVLFQMIARLACALRWFDPLAWHALRRLREERELACDDHVVSTGERAAEYADQLVRIARDCRPLRLPLAVAMAHSSKLEDRVVSLLDRARSHLPVGRRAARCIFGVGLAFVLVLSLVTLGERVAAAPDDSGDSTSPAKDAASDVREGAQRTAQGRVVDRAGKPIAGAKVRAILGHLENIGIADQSNEIVAEAATDADGRFRISMPDVAEVTIGRIDPIKHDWTIVASAEGLAPDWRPIERAEASDEIELRLVPDTVPLRGRILDLEGKPVAGARVRVRSITAAASSVDEWVAKARKNPIAVDRMMLIGMPKPNIARFPAEKTLSTEGLSLFPTATTDKEGRFALRGLGPDRYIGLVIEGPGIPKAWVNACTREMEPVSEPTRNRRIRNRFCYGATFDYAAEPSREVFGVVRDASSKKPIVGAIVGVDPRKYLPSDVTEWVSTTTDEKGRYRLLGLPRIAKGEDGLRLTVLPGTESPYFRTSENLPRSQGLAPMKHDIQLARGAWLTGRVTDRQTGGPLLAQVSYYPFRNNHQARRFRNFDRTLGFVDRGDLYPTNADGTFRIPAIPGRGVVVAVGHPAGDYRVAEGAERIQGLRNERFDPTKDAFGRTGVYHLEHLVSVNSVREVVIDDDADGASRNVELVPLRRQVVRLTGPDGKPLSGVQVDGIRPRSVVHFGQTLPWQSPLAAAEVDLLGLELDGRRLVLCVHEDRKLGVAVVVDGKTDRIRLRACATLTGRLLDDEGRPAADLSVTARTLEGYAPASKLDSFASTSPRPVQWTKTDRDGRFRLDMVPPGVPYEISTQLDSFVAVQKRTKTAVLRPGEVIDVGDVQPTNAVEVGENQ